jgi:zinc protease
MEDIRALSLPDIRAFYRTWYAPNNATLVCVGDFDEAALMDLVATSYGAIAPATLPEVPRIREPEQARERIVRAPKPIATDRLLIGYKAPGQDEADWAPLEIIATLLAGCPSARLYRRLVIEHETASSVDAQLTPFRDPSLLRLAVTASRGHTADEILVVMDRELRAMAERPPDRAEVEKAKAIVETDFWTSLVDLDGKAEAIGHYETALGDFRKVNVIAARLAAVTVEDVARCVRGYLRSDRRTIVIAEPESPPGDDDADDDADTDDEAEDRSRDV